MPQDPIAPIVMALELGLTPGEAFDRFAAGFGEWWPTLTHSLSRDPATRCALEGHRGGRVFETAADGTEHAWGEVTAYRPGDLLAFTWHPGRESDSAQWIEVCFEARPGGCRATLTHGGWDALGEIGPLLRQEYVPGWRHVFGELFARYAAPRD